MQGHSSSIGKEVRDSFSTLLLCFLQRELSASPSTLFHTTNPSPHQNPVTKWCSPLCLTAGLSHSYTTCFILCMDHSQHPSASSSPAQLDCRALFFPDHSDHCLQPHCLFPCCCSLHFPLPDLLSSGPVFPSPLVLEVYARGRRAVCCRVLLARRSPVPKKKIIIQDNFWEKSVSFLFCKLVEH